jgi:hypothetical protein
VFRVLISIMLVVALPAPGGAEAAAPPRGDPQVTILDAGMADSHSLRIDIATSGLEARAPEPPDISLAAWLDGVPARATLPLIGMPSRFAMILDLPAGVVRVGGVAVGTFRPVRRFEENLRFPVDVTLSLGSRSITARRIVTILLPTVIVPGYLNELTGRDPTVLAAFRRHGYAHEGAYPTLFWFTYPSRRITLAGGAEALAEYVRTVVLPATYAAKINVVGYSVGGLLARWNVAYDVDGWGSLVNRLVLAGVPNEGALLAYLGPRAPSFVPFSNWGKTALVRDVMPTFPFWRAGPDEPWSTPSDGQNVVLARLNARPIPDGIRLYLFYGSHDPRASAGPRTAAGVTGVLPEASLSSADGDGIVLAASAQGLPIHGGSGVSDLRDRAVLRVDLGDVYHIYVLDVGADRIAEAAGDRFVTVVEAAPPGT